MLTVPRAGKMLFTEFIVCSDGIIRERMDGEPPNPQILIFGFEGEMFFGAAAALEAHFETIESRIGPDTKVLVLRLKRVRNPDAVGMHLLDEHIHRIEARGRPRPAGRRPRRPGRRPGAHRHCGPASPQAHLPRAAGPPHQHADGRAVRLRAHRHPLGRRQQPAAALHDLNYCETRRENSRDRALRPESGRKIILRMATISEALTLAIQHHQAGRLPGGPRIYRRDLGGGAEPADAWHLLGVIAHNVGPARRRTVECIRHRSR